MTPQAWIEKYNEGFELSFAELGTYMDEGLQHLAAALEEIARLQAELAQAERVVVPEWSANDFALSCVELGSYIDRDLRAIFRNAEAGYKFAASRAHSVPASRVLKDGERAVDARRFDRMLAEENERRYLIDLERYVRTMAILQRWSKDTLEYGPLKALDALRAQGKEGAP